MTTSTSRTTVVSIHAIGRHCPIIVFFYKDNAIIAWVDSKEFRPPVLLYQLQYGCFAVLRDGISMRDSFLRTAAACCGLAVLAAAALTGCSDNDSSTAATTSAASSNATAAVAQADSATTKAVTDAYVTFFNGAAPADQRIAAVEKGQDFGPVLQAQSGNPQAQGTSATVSAVKLLDAAHADVTYTLLMGGNPVLPDQVGQAVKDGAQWKVAATTFCSLLALQGGQSTAC
ncbi:hypothetical protein [Nocardia sp. CA-120079]|uniref:hypothetical protein n=1 Tax=Nocardia sp. CA-120079 TaxID=3239974 RepID=UPI003D9552B5